MAVGNHVDEHLPVGVLLEVFIGSDGLLLGQESELGEGEPVLILVGEVEETGGEIFPGRVAGEDRRGR